MSCWYNVCICVLICACWVHRENYEKGFWGYIFRLSLSLNSETSDIVSDNSLFPIDTIWCNRTWSASVQVRACSFTAPSHYLNKYRIFIKVALWIQLRSVSHEVLMNPWTIILWPLAKWSHHILTGSNIPSYCHEETTLRSTKWTTSVWNIWEPIDCTDLQICDCIFVYFVNLYWCFVWLWS